MARGNKRPKPANVADLRARVVRGPDAERRWYWRVWRTRNGVEETVSTGWWPEVEIERVLAGLVTGGVDSPRARNRVENVRDLLEFWMGEQEQRADDGEQLTVTGKTGKRIVPLSPPLVNALVAAGVGEPSARVLACAHSTARAIYERLSVACRHAEVPYFAPGGLRRAATNALYRSGKDPSVAGAVIGHSPVVAMRHYRQIAGDETREAMRAARLGYLPDLDSNVVELPKKRRDG